MSYSSPCPKGNGILGVELLVVRRCGQVLIGVGPDLCDSTY